MTRGYGDYDGDEQFPNQAAFWYQNCQRALKGRKGRQALAELREALLMLPEKRLVEGAISTVALKAKADEMPDTKLLGGDGNWGDPTKVVTNYDKQDLLKKCADEGMGVCAVGAYLLRKRVLATGEPVEAAMAALPSGADVEDCYLDETAAYGAEGGLTRTLAWLIAERNDETYGHLTPEERYNRFLAWIDTELAATA